MAGGPSAYAERAKTVPLRLNEDERRFLRVLEAALYVSDYTDQVDVFSARNNKAAKIVSALGEMFCILSGMIVANNPKKGEQLVKGVAIKDNAKLFSAIFEAGRRYKVMNPGKMRSSYGKLMCMLQDAAMGEIRREIGFSVICQMPTVHGLLCDDELEALLDDDDLPTAVAPVRPGDAPTAKGDATARLVEHYAGGDAQKAAHIELALDSLADDEALTLAHVAPVQQMLDLLHDMFDRTTPESGFSLAINAGRNGARLSHSHTTQYAYVEQSLMLWREILSHLSQMWALAEADLLDGSGYRLRDTGQGVHRVCSAPHIGRFMQQMLGRLQGQVKGGWVGSSAVHLGDNDVPNGLVWIDKYTQIPRILAPVLQTLAAVDDLDTAAYVKGVFGSADAAKKAIVSDFFRHAFDGSGADNFYDAGSCIDGRLTSAWNWCSKLEKKSYAMLFKMAGVDGFDGDFK